MKIHSIKVREHIFQLFITDKVEFRINDESFEISFHNRVPSVRVSL